MNADFDPKSPDAALNWNDLDEQWRHRHDAAALADLQTILDAALYHQGERHGYPLSWRWARLSHFRGMQSTAMPDKSIARRHFAAGAEEAARATKWQPHRVEGHFWGGVCAIEAARAKGFLSAGRALKSATASVERAAAIDEEYHFAAPLRVLGRIMHLRPLLLGGSVDRALDIYRRALQIAPHNSTNLLYYSQALLADQQKPLARQTLHAIIDAPDDADWMWEQARDRVLARGLIDEMDCAR